MSHRPASSWITYRDQWQDHYRNGGIKPTIRPTLRPPSKYNQPASFTGRDSVRQGPRYNPYKKINVAPADKTSSSSVFKWKNRVNQPAQQMAKKHVQQLVYQNQQIAVVKPIQQKEVQELEDVPTEVKSLPVPVKPCIKLKLKEKLSFNSTEKDLVCVLCNVGFKSVHNIDHTWTYFDAMENDGYFLHPKCMENF